MAFRASPLYQPASTRANGVLGYFSLIQAACAARHIRSVIFDDDNKVSVGSRAICWAKRTLEIFDRLGCAAPMMQKGVVWNLGKVFFGDSPEPVYSFDLLPLKDQCFPAFINLQQYYAEEFLVDLLGGRSHPEHAAVVYSSVRSSRSRVAATSSNGVVLADATSAAVKG